MPWGLNIQYYYTAKNTLWRVCFAFITTKKNRIIYTPTRIAEKENKTGGFYFFMHEYYYYR